MAAAASEAEDVCSPGGAVVDGEVGERICDFRPSQ